MNKYNTKQKYGMGWYNESRRHSLARQGVKTGRKQKEYIPGGLSQGLPDSMFDKRQIQKGIKVELEHTKDRNIAKEIAKDHLTESPKYYDFLEDMEKKMSVSYSKIDYSMMNKLQSFLHDKFTKAVDKSPQHSDNPDVIKAKEDIKNVTNWSKFKSWLNKHKKTLTYLGLGGAIGIAAMSGQPTLMMNTATGEIVAVGGTLLGHYGIMGETVLTGMGVMEEVKVISGDSQKELFEDSLVKPEELKVTTPQPQMLVIKVKPKKQVDYTSYTDPEYGNLSELSSNPIPYNKLTHSERDVLSTAVKKVKKLLGKRGKKISFNPENLQVVDRVGPDDTAFGAHQDELIQINRHILKNPYKTEGVLMHECIHKIYNVTDETRELENLQIDYLGMSMDKV
jgi:hypothetical protein